MNQLLSITRKELKAYFGSPMAAIFVGTFLLAALFSFFWVDTFFARNTADIRPLFRWMPILLVFLVAALTMRQWSEEQKMGTLEILLTLPVRTCHLVLGKFLAVLALVTMALALTMALPVTVSMMGNLDWGPVFGGYLGTILLACAYIAIGLFISSRTDNQIISLILTVLLAGFFYMIGSTGITDFFGSRAGELLRALGTGSRFASIERGVLDIRDIVYYGALAGFFLTMNGVCLDRKRWGYGANTASYRRNMITAVILVGLNLVAVNIWLHKVPFLRLDLTQNHDYSLSETSRDLITNLNEPLLLQGYFSEKTHPLLAPLVPRIRDLMAEYQVASRGKIKVNFVDPKYDEELEAEANQQYGIKPVPFQVAGRYEASVVNSYFNILVKYGDQHVTLGFDDLIEIQRRKDGQLDVGLRNLEYDLTKSIKKVVYGFQSLASVFSDLDRDMQLTVFVTKGALPEPLADVPDRIAKVAGELQGESGGKFSFNIIDPDEPDSPVTRKQLIEEYSLQPFAASLFSKDTFFLHLLLQVGKNKERVFLTGEMEEAEIRNELQAALKRSSSGFLKTVGIWSPQPAAPTYPGMPPQPQPGANFQMVKETLRANYNLKELDLSSGSVPAEVDVLLVLAPQGMQDQERYAVDQYLMRGGAVLALAGNYALDIQPYGQGLAVKKVTDGLGELLAFYGVKVEETLVMDMQNEPFPIPVTRNLGGFTIQEIKRVNYPFFVDIREQGMNRDNPIVANLPAVTMNWSSPLSLDKEKNAKRTAVTLLSSSPESWSTTSTEIQPDFSAYPQVGFPTGSEMEKKTLAVAIQGSFASYFSDRAAPALPAKDDSPGKAEGQPPVAGPTPVTIPQSPVSSRLVVVGCAEFVNDAILRLTQGLGQDRFLNSLEFVQNMVDWSVEDEDLLRIRSRGSHARILRPMSRDEQAFWEWLNYGIALVALVGISLYGGARRRKEKPMELEAI